MIIIGQIKRLGLLLDDSDIKRLTFSAKKVDEIEHKYQIQLAKYYKKLDKWLFEYIMANGELPDLDKIDFTSIIVNNAFETIQTSLNIAQKGDEMDHESTKGKARLSKMPSSFNEMMKLWDAYRTHKKVPKRQKILAQKIKKAYLKKVKTVWEKYSKDFLNGDVVQKEEIIGKVQNAGKTTFARAKMIVDTETTYHYNKARKDYYDQSPDVTHYLFVSVRDHATTKWCKSRQGLVYEKDSDFLQKELPPIHWNCRSEILPLTPFNPKHLKLIENKSLRRENHKCYPLPPEWNGR